MQKGLELAAIKMPPDSLIRVVVNRQQVTTDWARPLLAFGMLNENIDTLCRNREIDIRNCPRQLKTQKVTVKFCIAHGSPLFQGRNYTRLKTFTHGKP